MKTILDNRSLKLRTRPEDGDGINAGPRPYARKGSSLLLERAGGGNADKNIYIVFRQRCGEYLGFLDDGAALMHSTHEIAPELRRNAPN